MRTATLLTLGAVLAFAAPAAAQCTGTEGTDFQRVTIDEITAVPQDNIDALNAAGENVTIEQAQDLLQNDLVGQTVEVTAVVMTNPLLSGVRSLNAEGIPNSVQIFVRDVAAATEGPEGMGLLINDEQTGGTVRQFFVGDEVVFCGEVAPFTASGGYALQIDLESATATGNAYGPEDDLLQPITITPADIHDTYGTGTDAQSQLDWSVFPDYVNQYVRFEGLEIIGAQGLGGDRIDVLYSAPGEDAAINQYDISVCFRNDRGEDYFPGGDAPDCIDTPFNPPTAGVVNLQGFLTFQGDDPFDFSVPDEAVFNLAPFEDEDFEIAVAPPIVTLEDTGLATTDGATVRATVVPATAETTVASVTVSYTTTGGGSGDVTLTNVEGDVYEGTITGLAAGDFVTYSITASDSDGATTPASEPVTRLVVDGPISSIFQVQATPDGGPGGSGITTAEPVAFDLDATVQSVLDDGGSYLTIQDDASLSPFSGVFVELDEDSDLAVGDQITISEARVVEDFDVTTLTEVSYERTGTGDPYGYKEVSTAIFNGTDGDATAEQHEGMLLTFADVTIVATNADEPAGPFGEFLISSDGTVENSLRVDDLSSDISYEGGDPGSIYMVGNRLSYIRGPLYYSFGNYKLTPDTADDIGELIVSREGDLATSSVRIAGTFPNPAAGQARVAFELATAGDVSLRLFDTMGREVAVVTEGARTAGAHSVTADLGGLASGVYVLRLDAAGEVATARIAVVR